jgi:hypothetical protein
LIYHYKGLSLLANSELVAMLKRKVDLQGRNPTLTGNKEELIGRLYEFGYVDFINYFHPIRDLQSSALVDSIWENEILPGTAPPTLLSYTDLATLRQGISLSYDTFIACIELINRSDRIVCEGYNQMYDATNARSPKRQRSLVVHATAAQRNMYGVNGGSLVAMGICPQDLPYLLYIPIRLDKCLIVVNFTKQQFIFYSVISPADPRRSAEKASRLVKLHGYYRHHT